MLGGLEQVEQTWRLGSLVLEGIEEDQCFDGTQ